MIKNKLHPGAKWMFRGRAYMPTLFIFIFLAAFSASIILFFGEPPVSSANLIAVVLLIFVIGEVYVQMSYNRWVYGFDKNSVRIERGIIWKRYSNIPYGRVQNVDIHRGVIARLLGFSTLHIQTAGYSGYIGRPGQRVHSEGYIPAVSAKKAEEIREFLMGKIGGKK